MVKFGNIKKLLIILYCVFKNMVLLVYCLKSDFERLRFDVFG